MLRPAFAALALVFSATPAFAGEASEAFIAEAANELAQGDLTPAEFREAVAVERIAGFTLGKYARRIEVEKRDRFIQALEGFLIETFEQESSRFEGANIEVLGSKDRSATDSIVETIVRPERGKAIKINWRVLNVENEWKIVDVQVHGLWLAIEQRAQIAAILDRPRGDIEDAIASLNG